MKTLLLIRHGQTAYNLERRMQGQLDIPLDETGLAQAERLARRLASEMSIDALYASDLARARVTAETVAAHTGLELRLDERLREVHAGKWQGCTIDQMDVEWPEWREHFHGPRMVEFGGETQEQVRDRLVAALQDIGERHPHETVAFVSHGFGLGCLVADLVSGPRGAQDDGRPRGNTAITIFEDPLSSPRLVLGNCTRHLDD